MSQIFRMHQNILVLVVCMCFCNLFAGSKAIFGEEVRHVLPGEYPYIVSVSLKAEHDDSGKFRHLCTSALVSNRDILTAAHCLRGKSVNEVVVIGGSQDLKKGRHVSVLWWLTYNQWANSNNISLIYRNNDIAMMRMRRNVSNTISPGRISPLRNRHLIERDVEISGWGRQDNNEYLMILQNAMTRVHDRIECQTKMNTSPGYEIYSDNVFFCTYSQPHVLAHKGDIGGPILYLSEIVGITIAVWPSPDEPLTNDKVNVHLGTYFYRNFIFDVIENVQN